MSKKVPLILVTDLNNYRRYVGKKITDHVISERILTSKEVEQFRTSPKIFKGESDITPPDVA